MILDVLLNSLELTPIVELDELVEHVELVEHKCEVKLEVVEVVSVE